MTTQPRSFVQQQYAEAMRFSGIEAMARLSVADRLADAANEAIIAEARRATPRIRPLVVSIGGILIRTGERLEAVGEMRQRQKYV